MNCYQKWIMTEIGTDTVFGMVARIHDNIRTYKYFGKRVIRRMRKFREKSKEKKILICQKESNR